MGLTILCIGDSNTWGYIPNSWDIKENIGKQYPESQRWTGILNSELKEYSCKILIDGANGRTINIDDQMYNDFGEPNGTKAITCFFKQHPKKIIGLFTVMLGTNDIKHIYKKTPNDIEKDMEHLIKTIKSFFPASQILIMSPPSICREDAFGDDFLGTQMKSEKLPEIFFRVAKKTSSHFLPYIPKACNADGVHLSEEGHKLLGKAVATYVKNIISQNGKKFLPPFLQAKL